jgi:UDP-N-acetylmuramate--alanine ligase
MLKFRQIHFVGIGGSGMSGIAEVLLNLGYQVSGSDQKRSAVTDRLAKLGARVYEGHAAANVAEAQVVVTSTAVKADNPEVMQARRQGLPVIPRAEMLAELMRLKYGVAVAGSHGKTTTTSMVAIVLDKGGLDPTVVVGGRVGTLGSGARLGKGEFMVAEADESDRSFLKLSPTVAIVTNIDREHLDTYKDLADVQEAFLNFVNKVPFYGAAVLCLDDPAVQDILPRVERRVVTYGVSRQAEVSARDVVLGPMGSTYTACSGDGVLGTIELPVPGHHNVLNSLAAVAVGLDLGVPFAAVKEGLASFTGVDRRFQLRGEAGGITVIDDYGHHPTEIRATLETLRGRAGTRRTVVLFQPHRYTRTQHLWDDFCRAFHLADLVVLVDIYPAGEEPIEGITSEALADAIARKGHRQVVYGGNMRAAVEHLLAEVREGDVVLTLGAGSVWTAGDELLRRRAEADPAGGGTP